jgi:GntR family transcriptional regulator
MDNGEITAEADKLPRYMWIQKALEDRIIAGEYPVGSLIPPEIDLALEFDSSRSTVREALRQLSGRGYVERKQGVGTRVVSNSSRGNYVQSFCSLEELFQVAKQTYFTVFAVLDIFLSAEIAPLVGGEIGEEWRLINGVRWTEPGGRPICYVQSYIPKRFGHLIKELTETQGPFFALLERHSGSQIDEVVQEIRAVQMPLGMSRQLGLANGAWSLQLLRRYLTPKGVLITSFNWHPADQMTYVMQIHRARQVEEEV